MNKLKNRYKIAMRALSRFIDGSAFEAFFVKHFVFITFILFLTLMYVGNRYGYDDIVRRIDLKEERIRELKDVSATISGDLMTASRPSQVNNLVKERGLNLEFAVKPPIEIE